MDEVDQCVQNAGSSGDPTRLLATRTSALWTRRRSSSRALPTTKTRTGSCSSGMTRTRDPSRRNARTPPAGRGRCSSGREWTWRVDKSPASNAASISGSTNGTAERNSCAGVSIGPTMSQPWVSE
jgi:hypothetical protein